MKKISIATGALLTLVLSALSVFAQTQSREDILRADRSQAHGTDST